LAPKSAGFLRLIRTFRIFLLRFATALGILMLVITLTPVLSYWISTLSTPWGSGDGDTLIVLGADITAPDMIGFGSYWRSYYTALTWRQGHFRRIIIAGKDIAPLMRNFIVGEGVPRTFSPSRTNQPLRMRMRCTWPICWRATKAAKSS